MSAANNHHRIVYFFGDGQADGGSELKHLVGGKGASLADMTKAGLNVPPGFTISAECCDLYYQRGRHWPAGLEPKPCATTSPGWSNSPAGPSVAAIIRCWWRCAPGAAQSMPGMMDTVLNVGLNPDCVRGMAQRTGNRSRRLGSVSPFPGHVRPHRRRRRRRGLHRPDRRSAQGSRQVLRGRTGRRPDGGAVRSFPASLPQSRRPRFADRSLGDAASGHRCRLRLVEQRAGRHLSPASQHRRSARHGGQRADDVPIGSLGRDVHRQPGQSRLWNRC